MTAPCRGQVGLAILLIASTLAPSAMAEVGLELLSETSIPGDLEVGDTLVGGLSGLAYDPGCDLYYALTDDRGNFGQPRFFTLRLIEGDGAPDVDVFGATWFRDADGVPFRGRGLDGEAIALGSSGTLYLATEGVPHRHIDPLIGRFRLDGTLVGTLELPDHYRVPASGSRGVRNNHGFESIALSPDETVLFAALENALLQDGPAADLGVGSPARILVIDLETGAPRAEYLYQVEPVPDRPIPESAFRTNGISEILALDDHRILVLERSFSAGVGNRVRLFLAELDGATDVLQIDGLDNPFLPKPRPVKKTLVADLADLGIDPDNLEAMAFGPLLADGRRLLVMMADNNFQPTVQTNQVLVFAVSGAPEPVIDIPQMRIPSIQGAGHFSPFVGRCVSGVKGVVTAILGQRGGQAFFIQDLEGDDDPATSDGVLVTVFDEAAEVRIGDRVLLDGRIEERSWGFELPVTRVVASRLEIDDRKQALPEPVVIGDGGRSIPRGEIASRRLTLFDPSRFAADAFEALEGMRVEINDALVVGPTSRHGEVVVVPDRGRGSAPWTASGGLRRTPCNVHPHRVVIDDRLVRDPPDFAVGDEIAGTVAGIIHYTYGNYKLFNTGVLSAREADVREPIPAELGGDETHFTVATFNLENLWVGSDDEEFDGLADIISRKLGNPDIVAVQEVQDDTGPEDDGVVTAERTMARLIEEVEARGGVRYHWRCVNPSNNADGGQPGANIRTGFLFNPDRVEFVDRADCGEGHETEIALGPVLSCSPGLVDPKNRAFGPRVEGLSGSRKPLVGEFRFNEKTLIVVNLHLASKGGDDPIFGRRQPRITGTTARRTEQVRVVAAFVGEIFREDTEASVIVLGDLNDFEKSEPLVALETAGLEDLILRLPGEERYTYVYTGNSQVLDHVLVSPALANDAEIEAIHVNADYPAAHRASDHDPIVVRLQIPE